MTQGLDADQRNTGVRHAGSATPVAGARTRGGQRHAPAPFTPSEPEAALPYRVRCPHILVRPFSPTAYNRGISALPHPSTSP